MSCNIKEGKLNKENLAQHPSTGMHVPGTSQDILGPICKHYHALACICLINRPILPTYYIIILRIATHI